MSWAQRRKATYTLSFLFFILIIVFALSFRSFQTAPSCFDGAQNQGEQGVDCGGPCAILCRAQYGNPSVLWVRWSKVQSSGTYAVLAYAHNPNVNVGSFNAPYTMTIYDKNNVILKQVVNTTYIPPTDTFTIFLDSVSINDKIPARITLAFNDAFVWQNIQNKEIGISVISKTLVGEDTKPKVLATLKNTTLVPINNIESIAILYDANDNAIAFSRTKTDTIDTNASADISFTWPEVFSAKVYKIDILSKVLAQ